MADEAQNQAAMDQQEHLKDLAQLDGRAGMPMPKRLIEEGQVEQHLKPVEKQDERRD